jgi:hypothetical protein
MKISDYKGGDIVEVLTTNPQTNKEEWRDAEVLDKRMIYPSNGSHHPPYPILIVRLRRTYCKATPIYRWVDKNIPVFIENTLEFYDKENDEGIINEKEIRLKDTRTASEIFDDARKSFYTVPEEFKKKL